MTVEEAREILIYHNKWRRDNHVPSKYEMIDPSLLGIAIEVAIDVLSEKVNSQLHDTEMNK